MLSRTAENLFWIARYIERAETVARLLEVGSRNALIPQAGGGFRNEWESILQASGTSTGFAAKYGDPVQRNIESYLFFDLENPSSIASCITQARENGRIVRTALTSQVWDALNTAFQEMNEMRRTERSKLSINDLIDWTIRNASHVRGAIEDTQLRNDGYCFLHIGFALERADATARLLDVKYFVLLPQVDFVGSGLDNYQWRTILRSMSAHRAFNWAYGGDITPAKIVDFLVLNPKMPRSLLTSATVVSSHLDSLARGYGRSGEAQTHSRALLAEVAEISVEDVFDVGLHEFLTSRIEQVNAVAAVIQAQYFSGEAR
ncbi:MAG: alpha-E domain-containing protein [Rhodobacteraceae bacterium]|nr:alpha-E domain-containing protein [Paracoccaceae bacterium]